MSTAAEKPNARADLVLKLLTFALDPSAQLGEAENAACRMVTIARREGVGFPQLAQSMALVKVESAIARPVECDLEMPFGKHAGMTLDKIGRRYPQYLRWVAENIEDEEISEGGAAVLTWLESRKRGAAA